MNKQHKENLNELELETEKRHKKREKRKRSRMRVSGLSAKKLQKIIIGK